jgi:hypothetical protein
VVSEKLELQNASPSAMENVDWNGVPWVWVNREELPNAYIELTRVVTLQGALQRAWLAASATTSFQLWINGEFVWMGPPREVPPYFYYDTIDFTSRLRTGDNELRIVAYHQGEACSYHIPTFAGLLLQGEIVSNGHTTTLRPPEGWTARYAPHYRRDAPRLFSCLGFSEYYDFTQQSAPEIPLQVVGIHPQEPLTTALPRDIPPLRSVVHEAVSIQPSPQGTVVDFGHEAFGFVEIELECEQEAEIEIAYAEGALDEQPHIHKCYRYGDVLRVKPGVLRWRSYEKRAVRYAVIGSGNVRVKGMRVIAYEYPYEHRYRDTALWQEHKNCEEGRYINQLLEVSARTIQICAEDLLIDCPWRERAQYFDALWYFNATDKLFGTRETHRRFLLQMLRAARPDGPLRCAYPSFPNTNVLMDYSASYTRIVEAYYRASGDREIVEACYETARAALVCFKTYENAQHILEDLPPDSVWIDNSFELIKNPRSAGINAIYAGGYRSLSYLAQVLGKDEEARQWQEHYQKIRAGFRGTFLRSKRLLDSDVSPQFEEYSLWNYHHLAETGWRAVPGQSFLLRTRVRFADESEQTLRFCFYKRGRVWLNGEKVLDVQNGGGWGDPPLFRPQDVTVQPQSGWNDLAVEVEYQDIDWEVWFGTIAPLEVDECLITEQPFQEQKRLEDFSEKDTRHTRVRPYFVAPLSQQTVGLSAYFGMLEEEETKSLLHAALPEKHYSNYRKRTTPFFAEETQDVEKLRHNVLATNMPSSLYYLAHALKLYGMEDEAKAHLRVVHGGMLERGATTWWEEWGTNSSLCHAWGSFIVDFYDVG